MTTDLTFFWGKQTLLYQTLSLKALFICVLILLSIHSHAQSISSFTPLSGHVGSTVTISGSGFNVNAANNIVYFGATRATVTTATGTSLTVTVPSGATHAPITVLNTSTSLTAYSTAFFFPTFTPNKGTLTTSDIAPKVDFATGFMPYAVALGDFNGDGKADLVTGNGANGPDVSVLRNTSTTGSISYASKVEYTTGGQPQAVVVCDLDGDGKLDIATANGSANNVSVLLNTSSGGNISFATKIDFLVGSNAVGIAAGDINTDGKPDLVVVNKTGTNNVSVLRNTSTVGAISFAIKVDFTVGPNPQSVAIGDIDGDGKQDIAVANDGAVTVSVLRNTSSISTINFATKVDFTADTNPYSILIGDLDGDAKNDIAVVNYGFTAGGNNLSVLRNISTSGTVNFSTTLNFITGTNPTSVAIGDLNGDGKLDLAVSNLNSNYVSLFPNSSTTGSLSFTGRIDVSTGTGSKPYSVAIGDIDGDSKPDIAAANSGPGISTVSIIRNTLKAPQIFQTGSVTNFSACTGTASASQSFSVRGINLVANITVTAPSGFEISTNQTTGYTSSITLNRTSDSVATTILYVRMSSSASGSPTGNIVCTSTWAVTQNLALNGLVKVPTSSTTNLSICPSALPYVWNGLTFTSAGSQTKTGLINAAGCDSSATLNLTIKSNSSSTTNLSICPSDLPYVWNGITFSSAGSQTKTGLINAVGCDSSATLNLTIKSNSSSTTNLSVCPSDLPYVWNGITFSSAGSQTKTGLTNAAGCDSSATLNLTVKSNSSSTTNLSICPSDLPYVWNGITFSSAGSQTKTGLINAAGCDSSATLNITVKSNSSSITNLSICPSNLPYVWNGITFSSAGSQTKTGLINAVGCDSSATLNLTVKSASSSTTDLSICSNELPYTWNGLTFTSAGSQTKTGLINAVGCDSSATLNLMVKSTSSSTTDLSICSNELPYTWNGLTFISAGSQTKTGLINAVGCDSSATLNLTVKSNSSSSTNLSICPSDLPYVWNGLTFTSAGSQTKAGLTNAAGCDSSATLNLTVNTNPTAGVILGPQSGLYPVTNYTYTVTQQLNTNYIWIIENGIIVNGQGTNSITIQWINAGTGRLKVEVTSAQGCKDSSILNLNVFNVGMRELNTHDFIRIYPNPASSHIKVKADSRLIGTQYKLTDIKGRVVATGVFVTAEDIINMDELSNGMYYLMIDQLTQPVKVIKQK